MRGLLYNDTNVQLPFLYSEILLLFLCSVSLFNMVPLLVGVGLT
jgi:hypothetical protein